MRLHYKVSSSSFIETCCHYFWALSRAHWCTCTILLFVSKYRHSINQVLKFASTYECLFPLPSLAATFPEAVPPLMLFSRPFLMCWADRCSHSNDLLFLTMGLREGSDRTCRATLPFRWKKLPCQLEGTHTLKADGLLLLFMRKQVSTDTSFTVTSSFVCWAIIATISIVNLTMLMNVSTSSISIEAIPISASLARAAQNTFVNTDFISRSFYSIFSRISSNIPQNSRYNTLK